MELKKIIKDKLRLVPVEESRFAIKTLRDDIIEIERNSVVLHKWEEVFLKIKIPFVRNFKLLEGKAVHLGRKHLVLVYPVKPVKKTVGKLGKEEFNVVIEEGGIELEIILKEKPETNVFEFPIETKDLKFYYQPPLNEEIKPDGRIVKVTETTAYVKDENGNLIPAIYRPPEVVGSYAVYHKYKRGDYTKLGGKNYKTGKAFHIYRPKVIDAKGNWIWANLRIDEKRGILRIEVDKEWLEKATYPVRIDPTFGYTSVGGTRVWLYQPGGPATCNIHGSVFTMPEDGQAESISVYLYLYSDAPSRERKAAIYLHSDSSLVGQTDLATVTPGEDWRTFSFSTKPSLSANTEYVLVFWGGLCDIAYSEGMYYDTGEPNQGHVMADVPGAATDPYPDPATFEHNDRVYSIYCTYTAAAPPTAITLTENLGLGEELTKTASCYLTLTESLGCGETSKKALSVYYSESLGLGESASLLRKLALTESLYLGEKTFKKIYTQLTDNLYLGEEIVKIASYSKIFTESLALSEEVLRKTSFVVFETLSLNEKVLKKLKIPKTEYLSLGEFIKKLTSKVLAESLALDEKVLRRLPIALSETLALSEKILRKLEILKTEYLSLGESVGKVGTFYKTFTESLGLGEKVSKAILITKTDNLGLAESVYVLKGFVIRLTETLSLGEAFTKTAALHKTFSESLGLSENVARAVSITKTDLLGLEDKSFRSCKLKFSERINISDIVTRVALLRKTLTEPLALREEVRKTLSISRVDNLYLEEKVLKTAKLTVSESVGYSDVVTITVPVLAVTLTESLGLGEKLVKKGTFYETFTESLVLSDKVEIPKVTLEDIYRKLLEIEAKLDKHDKTMKALKFV